MCKTGGWGSACLLTIGGGVRAGVRELEGRVSLTAIFLPDAALATGASAPSSPPVQMVSCDGSPSVASDGFASRIGRPPPVCTSPPLDKVVLEARIGIMWGSACVRSQLWVAREGKADAERWGASAPAGGPSSTWWVEEIRSVESQEHGFLQSQWRISAGKVGPSLQGPSPDPGSSAHWLPQ